MKKLKYVFLLPIILTMIVSIIHVVSWYDMANTFLWSVFMSISIEVGAMAALVAATKKIKGGVWFTFILVTTIQMIGNIFYSYKEIDSNGELFKSWVELTKPVWESLGSDTNDVISLKRWLAFLEGGLLPIISLTSLHFFIKYDDGNNLTTPQVIEKIVEVPVEKIVEKVIEKEVPIEIEKIVEKIIEKEVPFEVVKEVQVPIEVEKIVEKVIEKPIYVEQRLTDEEIIERFRQIASEQNVDTESRKLTYTK